MLGGIRLLMQKNNSLDTLFIVMPAYNEKENIENVFKQWYPILKDKNINSKLVIADSGSTDGTHEILENFQKKYPQLEILTNTNKQHGPKIIALYSYAIKHNRGHKFL